MPRFMNGVSAVIGPVRCMVNSCVVGMRGCTIANYGCLSGI